MECQHNKTDVIEYERMYQSEAGIEHEITGYTYCLDCGAEIEPAALEVLAIDRELNHVLPF